MNILFYIRPHKYWVDNPRINVFSYLHEETFPTFFIYFLAKILCKDPFL
jgi:hypothetical protein